MTLDTPVERFKSLANQLSYETLHLLDDLYTEDIVFIDPVGEFRGLSAVRDYYARLYEGVKTISFSFDDEVQGVETAVEPSLVDLQAGTPPDAVLFWTMRMEHKRFRKGETVALPGCSHLKFRAISLPSEISPSPGPSSFPKVPSSADASARAETSPPPQIKICHHRDYYDLGALLYERIPVLGKLIRSIKARL